MISKKSKEAAEFGGNSSVLKEVWPRERGSTLVQQKKQRFFFPHKTSKRRERKVEWFRGCCLALKEVEKARQGAAVCASGLLALQLSERRRRRRRRRRIGQMDWSLAGSVPPA